MGMGIGVLKIRRLRRQVQAERGGLIGWMRGQKHMSEARYRGVGGVYIVRGEERRRKRTQETVKSREST